MKFFTKVMIFSCIVLVVLPTTFVSGRPGGTSYEWPTTKEEDACLHNEDILEVCQKCAKQTKSNIVYPMCCTNKEDAFHWCSIYTTFGRD